MPKVASPPLPEAVTAGQLARLLGVSERVVLGRKADGRVPTAANGQIDLAAIVKAGVTALAADQSGGGDNFEANRSRESRLRGDILELKREMLRAELIPAEQVEAVIGGAFDAARAKLLTIPSAYGPRLAAVSEPNEAREVLTKAMHDALGDLADGEVFATVKDRARAVAGRVETGEPAGEEAGAAA